MDVRAAVPYTMPRGIYVMAALFVVASSLFALRYGLSRQLDLKQPLANFLPESLTASRTVRQAQNVRRNPKQVPEIHICLKSRHDPHQQLRRIVRPAALYQTYCLLLGGIGVLVSAG